MKVYVGVIEIEEGGTNVYVGKTKESVFDQIYDFVEEWWCKEFGNDSPVPEDKKKAVDAYFSAMIGYESYTIEDYILED